MLAMPGSSVPPSLSGQAYQEERLMMNCFSSSLRLGMPVLVSSPAVTSPTDQWLKQHLFPQFWRLDA